MFEQLEPLDASKHGGLRYHAVPGYRFAAAEQSAPISHSEFPEVAKHYPIVFPAGDKPGLPLALLGLSRGHNSFVQADGGWRAPYVPAHIQRYPFILGAAEPGERFAVLIDAQAPHFQGDTGEPLFSEDRQPAAVLQRAMDFLKRFQEESVMTQRLVTLLRESGVLVPQHISRQEGDQTRPLVTGFEVVDRAKLDALSGETFLDWRQRGILPHVYAHLASLTNVRLLQVAPPEAEGAVH